MDSTHENRPGYVYFIHVPGPSHVGPSRVGYCSFQSCSKPRLATPQTTRSDARNSVVALIWRSGEVGTRYINIYAIQRKFIRLGYCSFQSWVKYRLIAPQTTRNDVTILFLTSICGTSHTNLGGKS